MKTIMFLLALLLPALVFSTGTIKGKIIDAETEEPIPFANVILMIDGETITGNHTDFDGFYKLSGIEPGSYSLKASYVGYAQVLIEGLIVNEGMITYQDIKMQSTMAALDCVEITSYKVPLISKDCTMSGGTVTSEDISRMPRRSRRSSDVTIREVRDEGKVMYIDGVRVRGSSSVPKSAIDDKPSRKKTEIPSPEADVAYDRNTDLHHVLTAGELNDFSKWELWSDIAKNELEVYQDVWEIYPQNRIVVQLMNLDFKPLIDYKVKLTDEQGFEKWIAKTDNTGKAELWAELFDDSDHTKKLKIVVEGDFEAYNVEDVKFINEGINRIVIPTDCNNHDALDIAFVVDATGSMADEIRYLQSELHNIINVLQTKHPEFTINLGSVFYRDEGDDYITKKSQFSSNIEKTINFIKQQYAAGGGDGPEAVDEAIYEAVENLNWSTEARARLMFLILDAPPHEDNKVLKKIKNAIEIAAEKGIKIIPITASGINKSTEYLMRSLALATNGTYTFLTDHSGVGGSHIKPTTDKYDVELLNDLILRLIYQFSYAPDCNDDSFDLSSIKDTTYILPKRIIAEEVIDAEFVAENKPDKEISTTIFNENDKNSNKVDQQIENKIKNYVKFYPNPASEHINIQIEGKVDEIYLTDISGKLLQIIDGKRNSVIRLDVVDYPTGVYFIKYKNNDSWQTGKLIVRR